MVLWFITAQFDKESVSTGPLGHLLTILSTFLTWTFTSKILPWAANSNQIKVIACVHAEPDINSLVFVSLIQLSAKV